MEKKTERKNILSNPGINASLGVTAVALAFLFLNKNSEVRKNKLTGKGKKATARFLMDVEEHISLSENSDTDEANSYHYHAARGLLTALKGIAGSENLAQIRGKDIADLEERLESARLDFLEDNASDSKSPRRR